MKKLVIKGGKKLFGQVNIAGAKNAALPIMVASILTDEGLTLSNVSHVNDISTMANLLGSLGIEIKFDGFDAVEGYEARKMCLTAKDISNQVADYELVSKMRASILIMGPLLARFGKARISLPGGCAIGTRPIDLHLMAMEKLGATINLEAGYVEAVANGGLKGAVIDFEKVSVGATQNVLMAACLAKGETVVNNAAREPEIVDLAKCLNSMGAKISGAGTSVIKISGVEKMHKASHRIIGDRIEAGTYAVAAGITGGCIQIHGVNLALFDGFGDVLQKSGIELTQIGDNIVEAKRTVDKINPVSFATEPYPGFPTDMQAQVMALMTVCDDSQGTCTVEENIFENRFMHILELARMGANIKSSGKKAIVTGVKKLSGAEVMATDLRASVCLVLAALVANGTSVINRLYHLERGYEALADKLSACGADIKIEY